MNFEDPRSRGDFALELDQESERAREWDDDFVPVPGKVSRISLYRDGAGTAARRADLAGFLYTASRSAGRPLPPRLLAKLESALRADLHAVRVHTGPEAQRAAAALSANAFTLGTDIYFASGKFDPDSAAGQRLIAHEVAHAAQQGGAAAPVGDRVEVSSPGDRDEVDADAFADRFLAAELDSGAADAGPADPALVASMWQPRRSAVDAGLAESRAAITRHEAEPVIHRDGDKKPAGPGGSISTNQELEVAIPGGKLKIKGDGVGVELPFDEKKFPEEEFEESHRFEPLQFCPGVYGYISVGCSAGVVDSGVIKVSGTKSGTDEDPVWALTVGGTNKVKGEAKAWLGVGLAVGIPGVANLSAEATLIPSAELSVESGVTGSLTYSKSAGVGGYFEFPTTVDAALFVELALRLLYEVFWKDHPVEFAKYSVGKWDIAWAGFDATPRWTIGQGWSAQVVEPKIVWGAKPDPTHVGGRDPQAQSEEYKRRKAEYEMNSQGTGGGPSYSPDEQFEGDDSDVLVDDGTGVTELQPGSVPDADSGGYYDGGDEGGMCMAEPEPEEPVCRDAADGSEIAAEAGERVAAASSDSGAPLPDALRARLERTTGADLGDVRVHTSITSTEAARALRANAFATGKQIHFAPGKYDPSSQAGQRLIAHEVAHTVQQDGARPRVQGQLEVSRPGDAGEREADRFADAFVAGAEPGAIDAIGTGTVARDVIHREPEGEAAAAGTDSAAGDAQPQGTGDKKKKKPPKVTLNIGPTKKGEPISFSAENYRELYRQVSARAESEDPAGTHSSQIGAWKPDLDDDGDVTTVTIPITLTTSLPEWPAKSKQPKEDQAKFDAWLASVTEHEKRHEQCYRTKFQEKKAQFLKGPDEDKLDAQLTELSDSVDKDQDVVDQNQPAPLAAPGGMEKVGRKATGGGPIDAGTAQAVDRASRDAGSALPSSLRQRLEDSLGADLGQVRVHTGSASEQASRALRAQAYATGQDIHFARGKYDPDSDAGQKLVAHEVAHTVQQGHGTATSAAGLEVSSPADSSEVTADAFADRFADTHATSAEPGPLGGVGAAPAMSSARSPSSQGGVQRIQRQPEPSGEEPSGDQNECKDYAPTFNTPGPITGKLNGKINVPLEVTNGEHAPPATNFRWQLLAADGLEVGPAAEGGCVSLEAKVKKVVKNLSLTTGCEVGGKSYAGPIVTVNIDDPIITYDVGYTDGGVCQGPREASDSSASLMVRDSLVVRVMFENVEDPANAEGLDLEVSTQGKGVGESKKPTWGMSTVSEVSALMAGPGKGSVTVTPKIPGKAYSAAKTVQVTIRADLTWIKDTAATLLAKIGTKYDATEAAIHDAVEAYSKAKKAHEDSLENAHRAERIVAGILIDVFFAAAFGAAGGAVAAGVEGSLGAGASTLEKKVFGDSAKDVLKFAKGASKALKIAPPGPIKGGSSPGQGVSPESWEREMLASSKREKSGLTDAVATVLDKARNMPRDTVVDEYEGFDGDPVSALEGDETLNKLASVSSNQQDYARKIWEAWIANCAYSVDYISDVLIGSNWQLGDHVDSWGDKLVNDIRAQAGSDFGLEAKLAAAKAKAMERLRRARRTGNPDAPPSGGAGPGEGGAGPGEGGAGSGETGGGGARPGEGGAGPADAGPDVSVGSDGGAGPADAGPDVSVGSDGGADAGPG